MSTTDALRVGIIGTGSIADGAHGPALMRVGGVTLWSVLSRNMTRATQFAEHHNAAAPRAAHTSLSEFLNDPFLQAVIITSPDSLHAAHILECARAGKHVLVEKPMVTSHADGIEVIKTCREYAVKLGVAFHLRWHSGHRQLHKLVVSDGELGALRHIRVQWAMQAKNDSNWRAYSDLGHWWSLAATGAHCLDLIHWFSDSPERQLLKRNSLINKQVWQGPRDETTKLGFSYSDGLTAECTTSVLFSAPTRFEIYGTKGFAICEGTLGRNGAGIISINGAPFEFGLKSPFDGEIQDFSDAVENDREPEVSGCVGLQIVDEMLAAVNHTT
jgi:predicted dehydrogenase